MRSEQGRVVKVEEWQSVMAKLTDYSEIYFVQAGALTKLSNMATIMSFVQGPFSAEIASLLSNSSNESVKLYNESGKTDALARLENVINRVSLLSNKKVRLLEIIQELISSCFSLVDFNPPMALLLEWNEQEAWVHGKSTSGSYHRKDLANDTSIMKVMAAATDLFIRVVPGRGSWFAARVDLKLTNPEHDVEPKRLIMDDK